LAQQTFQRHLDDHLAVALIFDDEPFGHQLINEAVTVSGQVEPAGDPPQGLVVGWVDGRQPRNEGVPQLLQLAVAGVAIRRQHAVDHVLHHAAHPAHGLVLIQGDFAVAAVVLVQIFQGERQQR